MVQIRTFGKKSLFEPMLAYYQMDFREQISVTFQSKYTHFYKRKLLQNVVYKTADILSWFRYVNNLALILQQWIVPCFVGQCHVCEYPGC